MIDSFGVTDVWEHGSGAEPIEGYSKTSIVETAADLPDVPLVVLAPSEGRQFQGVIALPEYQHPKDAIYITGQNHVQFDPDFLAERNYDAVYIPAEKHEFYAMVAAACALYDRRAKLWAT
jgi:hypothetical protein